MQAFLTTVWGASDGSENACFVRMRSPYSQRVTTNDDVTLYPQTEIFFFEK